MNNRQVAQEWAKQSGQAYRRGSNFYYEGATIFSYGPHFAIARFSEFEGKRYVFFTEMSWGNSTAKHIGHVRAALHNAGVPVFYVPNLNAHLRNPYSHREIYHNYLNKAQVLKDKAARARIHKAFYEERAAEMLKAAEEYAQFFSLSLEQRHPA